MLLRAGEPEDVEFLQSLWADVDTWLSAQTRPYVPESEATKRQRLSAAQNSSPAQNLWLVVEVAERPIGVAGLWDIDMHNRRAQVAVTLHPQERGAGLGRDTLAVICDYAFRLRGLHRLQAETLVTNIAMQRTVEGAGFRREGVLRCQEWQSAGWCDVVVYGLLDDEWSSGAVRVEDDVVTSGVSTGQS